MPGRPGDADAMGVAVAESGKVVLPEWLIKGNQWLRPLYQWRRDPAQWNDLGFVNLTTDSDTFIRRQTLRATDQKGAGRPSLALAIFARSRGFDENWFSQAHLEIDGCPVPRDAQAHC